MAVTMGDQNHRTSPGAISAAKLPVSQPASAFHKTDRSSGNLAANRSNITGKTIPIYKEPVYQLAQLENQAMMQLFGGKTGGVEIENMMRGMGLSVGSQRQRQAALSSRNNESALNQ